MDFNVQQYAVTDGDIQMVDGITEQPFPAVPEQASSYVYGAPEKPSSSVAQFSSTSAPQHDGPSPKQSPSVTPKQSMAVELKVSVPQAAEGPRYQFRNSTLQASQRQPGGDTQLPVVKIEDTDASGESSMGDISPQPETSDTAVAVKTGNAEDDELVALMHDVAAVNGTGLGLVWAGKRQALCDALPYFKSHQGGTYTQKNIPKGMLLDQGVEPRDIFGRHKLITTVGGGRLMDASGVWTRQQGFEPPGVARWHTALTERLPVIIIAGSMHPGWVALGMECPHRYVVLGTFWVTGMWCEKVQPDPTKQAYLVFKLSLQKTEMDQDSWWWDETKLKDQAMPAILGSTAEVVVPEAVCQTCNHVSKHIYNEVWTCLHHKCEQFFKDANGSDLDPMVLTYTDTFLMQTVLYPGPADPHTKSPSIIPALPTESAAGLGLGTSKVARLGLVCPVCRCCSRRCHWIGWQCENTACAYSLDGRIACYPLDLVKKETAEHTKQMQKRVQNNARKEELSVTIFDTTTLLMARNISKIVEQVEGTTTTLYLVPHPQDGTIIGSIAHFRPNESLLSEPNGPDDLFTEIQSKDFGLTRNAARCIGKVNEVLTRNFQQNFGAHYEFGVHVPSEPFENAPDAILKAFKRLSFFGEAAFRSTRIILRLPGVPMGEQSPSTTDKWRPYNELLAVGYMEDDRISYHDDGEEQLDGTVSTLSIGSPAVMSWRMKKKYMKGQKHQDFLQVHLKHGDVVTMVGPALQIFSEHAVDPTGQRRFALTTRTIRKEALKPEDFKDFEKNSALPQRAHAYEYDGDISAETIQAAVDAGTIIDLED